MGDVLLDLIASLSIPTSRDLETRDKVEHRQGKKLVSKRPRRYRSLSEFQGLDWVELLQRYVYSKSLFQREVRFRSTTHKIWLIVRSSESYLTDRERQGIYTYLLSLTKEGLKDIQLKSRPISSIAYPDKKLLFDIEVSDYAMIFQHNLGKQYHKVLFSLLIKVQVKSKSINSGSKNAKFQLFVPPNDGTYSFVVNPMNGVISDKPLSVRFEFELLSRKSNSTMVDLVVEMLVQGGYRHFFTVKSRKEVDKQSNTKKLQKDTIFRNCTYIVPKPLVRLRSMLLYAKGLETLDIFRIQGASWEVQSLSTHVQKGTYYACSDPHAIATCLKLYLKSIPPVFAKVPLDSITALEGLEELKELDLNSSEIDLISWVVDLMALVVLSEATGMSVRSIAVVMAPNLYPISLDSNGSMRMTNFVSFLDSMVSKRIEVLRPKNNEEEKEDTDFDEYDDSYSDYL